ncbi:hypothetical protein POVWA2_081890 [Plasmodium ovale wallikeri]|uniref:Uncharacterized protein n=1 Tax=Plasmodium ovale wallikeri TaxID=864142 RepID=A0A1A8ZP13_PLAOA|nr:hypothetical protein POVWA1_052200 [Plasmodium ovale wallikeri]SBT57837.1 hypothetical protein POVWA2_081890 [Plasmodium ovale wallikeri]
MANGSGHKNTTKKELRSANIHKQGSSKSEKTGKPQISSGCAKWAKQNGQKQNAQKVKCAKVKRAKVKRASEHVNKWKSSNRGSPRLLRDVLSKGGLTIIDEKGKKKKGERTSPI